MATTANDLTKLIRPARGLSALLDFACGTHVRAAAFLIVVALLTFLPGFFQIPPIDRDEARFAQATKQMVESGEYIDIHFQDEVRYKKPVGIYWLQSAVIKTADALGVPRAHSSIWLYRLPSLIGATGAVLLTYWTALAFVSRRAAVLAGLMRATSIVLGVEARLAKTDAVLLVTILGSMGAMARVYLMQRRSPGAVPGWDLTAIFWTALAAGILIKGPLAILFVGLTALTVSILDRSAKWLLALRPLPGLIWLVVLVAPWFIVILSRAGETFITESVGTDMLPKIFSNQEGHGAPPGYYFLLFWVTFWPGAVLAGLAAPMVWQARREPGGQFLLAWLIPSWILFELVVTKLPHYVLPLYPAIAILIAGILDRGGLSKARWLQPGTASWFAYPVFMSLLTVAGFVWLGNDLGLIAWPFAGAAIVMGLFAWRLFEADGAERSLLRGCVAALLVSFTLFGVLLPSLPALFPSPRIAAELRSSNCPQPVAAAAGYHEPSLVFLAGTQTRLTDAAGAVDFLRQGPCRFAVLEGRNERIFAQRAEAAGLRYSPVARIDGVNYSIGRAASISIFRSGDAP